MIAQKIVSKAEGRTVDLADVVPSPEAIALAAEVGKDPRIVEVVLSDSVKVVRSRPNLMIMQHRLGFVMANAGVDQSNVAAADGHQRALLLPLDPDGSAEAIRAALARTCQCRRRHQRQFRPALAPRHRRRGHRFGRHSVGHRPARPARPVRPHPGGQHHRLRRRNRRRRFVAAGPGGRSAAGCCRARPDVAGTECAGGGRDTPAEEDLFQ